jgi:hypothetical protein
MVARHVRAANMITVIGKEANDLDERAAGIAPDPHWELRLTVYGPPVRTILRCLHQQ